MFEKVGGMLLRLAENIPDYKHQIDAIRRAKKAGQLESVSTIVRAMSHVYEDVPHQVLWIFDAIDECSQPEEFFTYLSDIIPSVHSAPQPGEASGSSGTTLPSIIMLSRPDVSMSRDLESCTYYVQIDLGLKDNYTDVYRFAHSSLSSLLDDGIITEIFKIAEHANGMFLWLLSNTERRAVLTNLRFIKGLEGLYDHIFRRIASSHGKPQQERIKNAFRWVARTLREAISISPEVPFSSSDVIPLSQDSLARISGALLEISFDQTAQPSRSGIVWNGQNMSQSPTETRYLPAERSGYVRPIHTSMIEYLQDLAASNSNGSLSGFQAMFALRNGIEDELFYLRCCLSYMNTCIKPGPLSGSTGITASVEFIKKRYPFLEYAGDHWLEHAQCFVTLSIQDIRESSTVEAFLSAMRDFLIDTRAIRRWIEVLFLFDRRPNISTLLMKLKEACSLPMAGIIISKGYSQLHSELSRLSKDLEMLVEEWEMVLRDSPDEIWSPSIPAFQRSSFWTTKHATTHRLHRGNERMVTIDSAVSSDGSRLGVVRLQPPRNGSLSWYAHTLSASGWQAVYELWTLDDKKVLHEVRVDISEAHMARVLEGFRDPVCLNGAAGFLELDNTSQVADFHVAFSPDLMRVLILSTVVVLTPLQSHQPRTEFSTNIRYLEPWGGSLKQNGLDLRNFSAPTWGFRALFHPTGQYLLILRPGSYESCEFAIFGTSDKELSTPMCCMSLPWDVLPFTNDDKQLYGLFSFHPSKPILLISQVNCVFAWLFDRPDGLTIQIRNHGMSEMEFSSCGRYVKGYESTSMGYIGPTTLLDLGEAFEAAAEQRNQAGETTTDTRVQRAPGLGALLRQGVEFRPEAFREAGVAYFRPRGTEANASIQAMLLHRLHDQQAVVLHTLSSDGSAQVQTLTRLSRQLLDLNNAILVPVPAGGASETTDGDGKEDRPRRVRVVLTRKQHWSFSLGDERPDTDPVRKGGGSYFE
ncbi:hypothetical protein F4777DRAFT_591915 [Nemania sp. FL0916]|nr:hypothetical protein F4777DRAFT_591915 [Nemania sp. FL0916]